MNSVLKTELTPEWILYQLLCLKSIQVVDSFMADEKQPNFTDFNLNTSWVEFDIEQG